MLVTKPFVLPVSFICMLFLLANAAPQGSSADPGEEGTRQLWDENLRTKRPAKPAAAAPRPASADAPARRRPESEQLGDAFLGFTLWHLRSSRNGDEPAARLLVQEEDSTKRVELTAERVTADTPLPDGSKIRVSIESARAGYLYVIDREAYADGSFSDPYLIFPTTRIRGGNNMVGPGAVVEFPHPDDNVPYFTLHRNRARHPGAAASPEQVSEVLTIVVAPKPIPELRIGRSAQRLSDEQVRMWENQWRTQTKSLDARPEVGKQYTQAEKIAAQTGDRLTAEDPLPQTIVQCEAKPGDPLLVNVPIKIVR
jgi:hypothetical protein